MKYKAILFDMDGTLLPMDNDVFTKGYFKFLYKKLLKYNLDPKEFEKNMWLGVAAMVKNDGTRTNEEAFWEIFMQLTNLPKEPINSDCVEFYGKEFADAKQFTGENPHAKEAVEIAKEVSECVALATNPLFPMVGQRMRMSWIGLCEDDFKLVTNYETDCYCKPNPAYYLDVCKRIGVAPEDCLMIGNDEYEDMYAARKAGMSCYLVTDCMIESKEHPWDGEKGTFLDMIEMLKSLRD